MESGVWKFKPLVKGDMISDPIQDEFFKTSFTKSIPDALVRETIQNSLDAFVGSEKKPVIIRFYLSPKKESHELPHMNLFFNKIKDHVHSYDNGLLNPPDLSSGIHFLVIEDFTTKGLEGDPNKAFPTDDDQDENFFYFWRNYGRSGKSEKDRGRWGLGKTVFSAVSQISAFFGLTIRNSDHRILLMGQSVLKTHSINNKYFSPYGYYGIFGSSIEEEHFARPIEDPVILGNFITTFGLARENDPGLSIVIPYPDPEITSARLCEAAIQQFFYPIIAGDLIVGIIHDNQPLTLASDSVKTIIESDQIAFSSDSDENLTKDNFMRLIAFTEWILKLKDEDFIILNEPENLSRAPKWTEDLFDSEQLKDLRTRFDSGEPLAFGVPIKVHKKGFKNELSWFKVFLQRDENLNKPQSYFIREGVTIPGVTSFRERRIRGIVVIDTAPLTTMLGDAENPAHTEWHKDSSKFKNYYEHGPSCLKFVKDSMREIVWRLAKPAESVDRELLSDIFFIEIPLDLENEKQQTKKKSDKDSGEDPDDDFNPPESKPKLISLTRVKRGIAIRKNPVTQQLPVSVRAEFAYNVRKGNPFKKYLPIDFSLESDPLVVESENVKILSKSKNILEFEIEKPEFTVVISGFDENRDLVVKATYRMGSA
jgi:hypothetical protein